MLTRAACAAQANHPIRKKLEMDELNVMLSILLGAFLTMTVGFAARERDWGVALIGLGIVGVMSVLGYKMYITFGA